MIEPSFTARRISFCSRVYMYVHRMRYLHHEVHELDGYNQEFWKTAGYSLECVLELVASTSHAKVPSEAPHSTGLSRTSVYEDLDFLSHYRAANRIKPLVATSTNDIVI